jgi:RimJ/RimL family protein N-acetyltransferase
MTFTSTLESGLRVRVRPIQPTDREALRRGFDRLSGRSRHRRLLSAIATLRPEMLARFTDVDNIDHFAWVALEADRRVDPEIGVGRYIRDPGSPGAADFAVTVLDEYQGMGVGRLLLRMLCTTALGNGIDHFSSLVLEDNLPMLRPLSRFGARLRHDSPGGR